MRTAPSAMLLRAIVALGAAVGAAAFGGCGGEAASPDNPDGQPPGQPAVVVSGRVRDSVTGDPIVGATVAVNDKRTTTDSAGGFSLGAPSHFIALQIYHPAYADYLKTQTVPDDGSLVVVLPPLAPYAWACRTAGDSVVANVTDLQGRKTIVRRDTSGVRAIRGTDTSFHTAYIWRWIPIDYLTYEVRLRVEGGPFEALRWHIYDTRGHILERPCLRLRAGRSD